MSRNFSVIALVFILMAAPSKGCHSDESYRNGQNIAGESGVKYQQLIDVEYWGSVVNIDELTAEAGDDFKPLIDAVISGIGLYDWRQGGLQQVTSNGYVQLTSVQQYIGKGDGDSLGNLALSWAPGASRAPAGFQRDNLLAMLSFGNPTAVLDVYAKWLIDSKSFENILDAVPYPEEMGMIKFGWTTSRMTAKGMWYTAKEDYYPLIGESFTIAFYKNRDFLGWDDIYSADNYQKGSPVRFVISAELGKPGLGDKVNEVVQDYIDMFSPMRSTFGMAPPDSYDWGDESGEDDSWKIKTKDMHGHKISYMDIEDAFSPAWMEYGGSFFISDLAMLENIESWYNPKQPVKDVPAKFNTYLYLDAGGCIDYFYKPFEQGVKEEYEYSKEYLDDAGLGDLAGMLETIGSVDLGVVEGHEILEGKTLTSKIKFSEEFGNLMLKGQDLLGKLISGEINILSGEPGPYSGEDPARPWRTEQMKPYEPQVLEDNEEPEQ